jgi:hypothetical protein
LNRFINYAQNCWSMKLSQHYADLCDESRSLSYNTTILQILKMLSSCCSVWDHCHKAHMHYSSQYS